MVAIAPGDDLSPDNPIFETFIARDAFLVDPFSLAFQIFDATDDDVAPAQVYPVTPGDRQSVDLTADKLGTGHFVASWTAPGDLVVGRHFIRWFCTIEDGDRELTWSRYFDVLPFVPDGLGDTYALVADVRAEGVAASIKNVRIAEALGRSAELIREWTGHDFTPRAKTLKADLYKSLVLPLNEPICAIDYVRYDDSDRNIDRDSYRVYARHLSQSMHREDDRDSPRIEMIRHPSEVAYPYSYPIASSGNDLRQSRRTGAQQIVVSGVFGYTMRELRGCPVGATPPAIRRANVLLALRDLPKAATQGIDPSKAQTIKREKTREQEVEYDTGSSGQVSSGSYAPFTGDPEIDRLLLSYCKALSGTGV
jgi:hypothetical protein